MAGVWTFAGRSSAGLRRDRAGKRADGVQPRTHNTGTRERCIRGTGGRGTTMDDAQELIIEQIEIGPMKNFTYLVGSSSTREVALVDPAWAIDALLDHVASRDLKPVAVLATHYHPDHVGGEMMGQNIEGVARLLEREQVKVYAHKLEAPGLRKITGISTGDMVEVDSGDRLQIGDIEIEFLHTPGHTPGSQCFRVKNTLVSGDTLFIQGCGRVDLPGSNPDDMFRSLRRLADAARRHGAAARSQLRPRPARDGGGDEGEQPLPHGSRHRDVAPDDGLNSSPGAGVPRRPGPRSCCTALASGAVRRPATPLLTSVIAWAGELPHTKGMTDLAGAARGRFRYGAPCARCPGREWCAGGPPRADGSRPPPGRNRSPASVRARSSRRCPCL